jgi:hypothetical protein
MNAYDIMHEWDRAAGKAPRSDQDLDREVPALLAGSDYGAWKARLEARDVAAIRQGLECWGLPIGPLGAFEIDAAIETVERPD